ncbi:hypothetical protein P879_04458 [Paragonimus westermani]|uniref:Uncharacterized protein n=1 Tax=Paragonimus westermani TaxID=34504 RepID=A0A8T0DH93_9TREM|nr:hypothetical protein P879_04458 [Paragonimus westermani]
MPTNGGDIIIRYNCADNISPTMSVNDLPVFGFIYTRLTTSDGHTMKQFTSTGVGPRTAPKTRTVIFGNSGVHESFRKEMNELEYYRLQPVLQQYILDLGSQCSLVDGTVPTDSSVNVLHTDNLPGSLFYVDRQQQWQSGARVNFEYTPNEGTVQKGSQYPSSIHLDGSELSYDRAPMTVKTVRFVCPQKKACDYSA